MGRVFEGYIFFEAQDEKQRAEIESKLRALAETVDGNYYLKELAPQKDRRE